MPREVNQDFDISIHYSGEITDSHKLGLRTYANTLKHFSAAVDRAILSESRGNIHKFARITHDEREDLEFTVLDPEDGGIILKFLSSRNNQLARRVAERMAGNPTVAAVKESCSTGSKKNGLAPRSSNKSVTFFITGPGVFFGATSAQLAEEKIYPDGSSLLPCKPPTNGFPPTN